MILSLSDADRTCVIRERLCQRTPIFREAHVFFRGRMSGGNRDSRSNGRGAIMPPERVSTANHRELLLSSPATTAPVRYQNYPTLMSGTCHPQCRSSSDPPRVITRPASECICADRIDGGKTQGSVIGDTALLINHCQVQRWP